ncbi:MAG TPA: Rieske 2Fe-2S domain-containing protein, partial [Steroidobacteraceae bacterium]|nr:Rieske 2Fe-2S domain-containing protein [Steroidobacteraceae bacterium]
MTQYRGNPDAIRALVRSGEVHRDVYTDPALFELEMERLWRSAWVYVGHDSQVPKSGDYLTIEIAGQPLLMLRSADGEVRVFYNRCAHRGARLASASQGNCGGLLRCPYHGWTYRLDGTLRTVPLKSGYADSGFEQSSAARGLRAAPAVASHRGFVFVRLAEQGPSFTEYFGESLTSIDNMADRSPEGRLEVVGGTLRYLHDCNWKMFIENLNDTMHPMVAHESSAGTARDLWKHQPPEAPKPMVIEQFVPFVSSYEFFDQMGVKLYENGHSYTGVKFSIHSKYSAFPDYDAQMVAAYGAERAHAILSEIRHNTVYYPSLTVKG